MSIEGGDDSSGPTAAKQSSAFSSRWLTFDEANYTDFCKGSEQGDSGKWDLLVSLTNIEDFEGNMRANIVLEFLFQNMLFCCENEMNFKQACLYMAVVSSIYEQSCVLDPHSTQESAIASFQAQMHDLAKQTSDEVNSDDIEKTNAPQQSSSSSSPSPRLFNIAVMKSMATFFSRTFLRYFAAYKYVHDTMPEFKVVHVVETAVDTVISGDKGGVPLAEAADAE